MVCVRHNEAEKIGRDMVPWVVCVVCGDVLRPGKDARNVVASALLRIATFDHDYEELLKLASRLLIEDQNNPSEGPSKSKLPASPDAGGGPIS